MHSRFASAFPSTPSRAANRLRGRLRLPLAAAAACAALVLAGCSGGSTPASSSGSSAAATGVLSDASIKTIAAYTGSTPGAADSSLAPITWGYVNQEGGAVSFPQYTKQVSALVTAVNNQLGGIGGHPLKLDVCHVVSSDEEGQTCGQQFANNKDISLILQFPLINGDAAFHRVIDPTGIPVFGPNADSTDDATPATSFFASAPAFSTVPILSGYTINTLKATSVAIIGIEGDALSQFTTGMLKNAFDAAGVTTKLATISATSSDVTAPLVAAGATSADAIVATLATTSQCSNVYNALKSLGADSKPVVSLSQCATDDVKAAIGDYPAWTFLDGYPSHLAPPADDRETAQLAVADDLWAATGSATDELIYASPSLIGFLTALSVVNSAGAESATAETTIASAHGFKGPLFLGPPTVAWNSYPGFPAVATLSQRLYTYKGDGTWVDAGNGWYAATLTPPPAS